MVKSKKTIYGLTLTALIIIAVPAIWFFTIIFEREKPVINPDTLPGFISQKQKIQISISDMKLGIQELKVSYSQGAREVTLLEKEFPYKEFLIKNGLREYTEVIELDPMELSLAQGKLDFKIQAFDYSKRNGGDGNISIIKHSMIVDTIPPAIRARSRQHYFAQGGSGIITYKTSPDTVESGVYVNDKFFKGFPAGEGYEEETCVAYFALPFNEGDDPEIYLWAKDKASNTTQSAFYYHIKKKSFRDDSVTVSDRLLKRILPNFDYCRFDPALSDVDKFVKINNELRKKNKDYLLELSKETKPEKLWEGAWKRMKGAEMAGFADHRSYLYNDEKIDDQNHMGIDLASFANSPIEAANDGVVIFAQKLGIYGLTVVIDHGQGLASLYGHLSSFSVAQGSVVKKGDVIAYSGRTGLANGDHLHFSILVHGIFVNPLEWWDAHWIKNNITRKLDLMKKAE